MFMWRNVISMNMDLNQQLREKKSVILKRWCSAVLAVPADESSGFLEKQNALTAEIAGSLEEGIGGLFDALLQGAMTEAASRFLDGLIRIMALSDFTASQTVGIILALKEDVRKELGSGTMNDPRWRKDRDAWDAAVDDMALLAFDNYMRHREAILESRAEEEKKETLRLLKEAKLISDDQE